MKRYQFYGIIGLIYFLMSNLTVTFAQNIPKKSPDASGDYYSNEAPLKGTVPRPLMPGSLWLVVVENQLNCRQKAGINQPVVKLFKKGDIIQTDVGRGGSDELFINALDDQGKPWMYVRGGKDVKDLPIRSCYVRANKRYIQPYQK
jgi:hypothetical protein